MHIRNKFKIWSRIVCIHTLCIQQIRNNLRECVVQWIFFTHLFVGDLCPHFKAHPGISKDEASPARFENLQFADLTTGQCCKRALLTIRLSQMFKINCFFNYLTIWPVNIQLHNLSQKWNTSSICVGIISTATNSRPP